MRTATIYNFLLEANLMASAAILLMILFSKFLRKPLGNRLIYFLWLLIAIRLICPLALSNPLINEIRPVFLSDEGIRPIAGQIKIRLTDAVDELRRLSRYDRNSVVYQAARSFVDGMYYGTLSRLLMQIYLWGAGALLALFGVANIRFRRRMRANRIEEISGKLKDQYLEVCRERGVKPIPVWFADPLPSACLVGVLRPYIALPLTAAPQEAIHVLTHEVCHYQGRDHWFSLLRLVCCVVHWFNPLVWVAAFMSRTDGELACDSRVVERLTPEDRMNYTNTLVLAASKRYAPGVGVLATGMTMTGKKLQNRIRSILNIGHTAKWLMVTTAVLAVMALASTFFTAELRYFPKMPQVGENAQLMAALPLENEEDAKQYAHDAIVMFLPGEDLSEAQWEVAEIDATYEIQITREQDVQPMRIVLLKDGTITEFHVPSNIDRAGAVSNLYEGQPEKQAEVAQYVMSLLQSAQPAVAATIEALSFAGEGAFGTERFVSFYGGNEISKTAFWVSVQVLPEVQIVSYYMNVPTLLYWRGDTEPPAPQVPEDVTADEVSGYQLFDMTEHNLSFGAPTADAMPVGDALEFALQALKDIYGESNLERFYAEYGFSPVDNVENLLGVPYWQFSFRNASDPSDHYEVLINAESGEVLVTGGPNDSNG